MTLVDLPGTTIEEKLDSCMNALRKDQHDELVVSGNLSKSHNEMKRFLKAVIKSKGRKGGHSKSHVPIMYICGAPGSGKTMSTLQLCEEAIEDEKNGLEIWDTPSRYHYVNCSHLHGFSKDDVLNKIMNDLNMRNFNRPSDSAADRAIILILDEVDTLMGSNGTEGALRKLCDWAIDESQRLSMIGISNAVNNSKSMRLFEYGMGVNKLVFSPYGKDELVKITEAKIGFSVVDKKAMEFIAAKVSASSGDARKYLELVVLAIQSYRQKLPLIELAKPLTKPVVTIRQAMIAIRDSNTKYTDIIQSITTFEKVTLCVGVHLARKFDGNGVTVSQLKDLTMECFGADNDVSIEDFKGVVERLVDSGLLLLDAEAKRKLSAMRMGDLMRTPIGFDLQLEDVVSALDDTLMKEDFYKRLVERVKSIKC